MMQTDEELSLSLYIYIIYIDVNVQYVIRFVPLNHLIIIIENRILKYICMLYRLLPRRFS